MIATATTLQKPELYIIQQLRTTTIHFCPLQGRSCSRCSAPQEWLSQFMFAHSRGDTSLPPRHHSSSMILARAAMPEPLAPLEASEACVQQMVTPRQRIMTNIIINCETSTLCSSHLLRVTTVAEGTAQLVVARLLHKTGLTRCGRTSRQVLAPKRTHDGSMAASM